MVQALGLDDRSFRGQRFEDHPTDLSRFVDILSLTQPEEITRIHRAYLAAGADIVETNTFGASAIGMRRVRPAVGIGSGDQSGGGPMRSAGGG